MRDDGSSADDCAISDPHPIQDNDAEPQPYLIPDDYVSFSDKRLADEGFLRADAMIVRVKRAPGSDMDAAAYQDSRSVCRELAVRLNMSV